MTCNGEYKILIACLLKINVNQWSHRQNFGKAFEGRDVIHGIELSKFYILTK